MSMMKTLAKVAIGVAVAKGASKMLQGRSAQQEAQPDGGLFGNQNTARTSGGVEDQLRDLLGGGADSSANTGSQGGLGGLLESLAGGAGQSGGSGGGINDLLGSLTGGAGQSGGTGGGLGDLLGGLTGGADSAGQSGGLGGLLGGLLNAAQGGSGAQGGFGDMLNQALAGKEPEAAPSADQEAAAALMLSAMIQAAKSDGKIDAAEEAKLLDRLGDVSREEQAFVQEEMRKPVDVDALARAVPRGLEAQVYAMSVMGIDLDSRAEAQYLHSLAQALGIDQGGVNHIHGQLGVPSLYS